MERGIERRGGGDHKWRWFRGGTAVGGMNLHEDELNDKYK
jgi:hypothetical protein